jgi:hypothetical protein
MEEISRAVSAIAQSRQPRFPGTGTTMFRRDSELLHNAVRLESSCVPFSGRMHPGAMRRTITAPTTWKWTSSSRKNFRYLNHFRLPARARKIGGDPVLQRQRRAFRGFTLPV